MAKPGELNELGDPGELDDLGELGELGKLAAMPLQAPQERRRARKRNYTPGVVFNPLR